VGPPAKPEYGNECGTNLLIREKGKTKIIKSYSKFDKIQRNFMKIQRILSLANVSQNIIEEVKTLYDKVAKNMNMQGRNIDHIIIGIYYYAIRKLKQARTLKEVAKMFKCVVPNLTERIVKKAFNSIKREIAVMEDEKEFIDAEKNYIQTFIGENEEKYSHKILAYQIIDNINNTGLLEGKNPKTIAGLSLLLSYKLLNDNFNDKKEFYSMFSNKATLQNSYALIKDSFCDLIPQEYSTIILNDIFP
jgi:transcription initiation factor TFIIIB Brf1 subunit/transcription initiation factor TFIIB